MDPLSIIAGTAGVLDVSCRFLAFVKDVKKRSGTVDQVLQTLSEEVKTIQRTTAIVKDLFKARVKDEIEVEALYREKFDDAWLHVYDLLHKCKSTIGSLLRLLEEIQDVQTPKAAKRFHGVLKELKRRARDADFVALRRELTNYCHTLQLLLSSIEILSSYEGRSSQKNFADEMRDQLSRLSRQIAKLYPLLESQSGSKLRGAFDAATAVASLGSQNEHFDIPQSVSSIFTGREDYLKELASLMFNPVSDEVSPGRQNSQKRFVIYGLGGSGKTQFCCKFAQDNRRRFWGVFWVDCSSIDRAQETFGAIAKTAGLEPNERAAKKWLSSVDKPWLLIIDNVDDANFPLDDYFPKGENGHILITTRNPPHKTQGTIGRGFFDFSRWNSEAAPKLLLKASNEPRPWSDSLHKSAVKISDALGELPVALIVAGRTIMKGLCSWHDYLRYFETSWKRMRARARGLTSGHQGQSEKDSPFKVYASFEMMLKSLGNERGQTANDAMELLNVFSFLYRGNISVSLLTQAVINPRLEQEQDTSEQDEQNSGANAGKRVMGWMRDASSLINTVLKADQPRPILPQVLRLPKGTSDDFDEDRLREALVELSQRSLIMYHTDRDAYSMHPLLHTWVRERPEMRTADQAIWCKAAATVLSQAILLPPLGRTTMGDDFRRTLLPHVLSVRRYSDEIERYFSKNRAERKGLPLVIRSYMDKKDAVAMAKYGLVFSQCGMFEEAVKLQYAANVSASEQLGASDPCTIKVQLALASTYWQLGEGNQAAVLQEGCLENLPESLREDHPQRLRTMDSLGESRWMQGRYDEALELHSKAMKGFTAIFGPDDENTCRAKDHLGRVESKFHRYESAHQLHLDAVKGLTATLGEEHLDTIIAKDNLAQACLGLGDSHLDEARTLAEKVREVRTRKLGRDHPYSLWATLNLAQVKAAQGNFAEAENDIKPGLHVALKTLGGDHVGVLWARMHLGWTYHLAGRDEAAIEELKDVIERQAKLPTAVRGMHPDRLTATVMLSECYANVGRRDEAIAVCTEAVKGHREIGGHEVPVIGKLEERIRELKAS